MLVQFIFTFSLFAFAEPAVVAPPYIAEGDRVEKIYLQHVEALKSYYSELKDTLQKKAPALLAKLSPAPPSPVPYGYQILPKVIERDISEVKYTGYLLTPYSWVRTSNWLSGEQKKFAQSKMQLRTADAKQLDDLITKYQDLESNQKLIDIHIKHNRLWQNQIASFRKKYDDATLVLDDLLAGRQKPEAVVSKTISEMTGTPAQFVHLLEPTPGHYIIQVNVVTDIQDRAFVELFKRTISKYWKAEQAGKKYEIRLDIQTRSPGEIYKGKDVPKKGDKIDFARHVPLFAGDRAVLTTGGTSTYCAMAGGHQYVVVGPWEMLDSTLAHEFGHILALPDAYFRGYRDLGVQGFEILEILPDRTDLMASSSDGVVKLHHFEILVKLLQSRKL